MNYLVKREYHFSREKFLKLLKKEGLEGVFLRNIKIDDDLITIVIDQEIVDE